LVDEAQLTVPLILQVVHKRGESIVEDIFAQLDAATSAIRVGSSCSFQGHP